MHGVYNQVSKHPSLSLHQEVNRKVTGDLINKKGTLNKIATGKPKTQGFHQKIILS